MTKEEAQKKCDELNLEAEQKRPFCPLIQNTCKVECVCFGDAKPYQGNCDVRNKTWSHSWNAGCFNAMFYGFEINP